MDRAAAALLDAYAQPAPPLGVQNSAMRLRPCVARNPARLEMVRAMAESCRRVWASNPGLTGWTMREHRAGVNVACFLVEEQMFARKSAARRLG